MLLPVLLIGLLAASVPPPAPQSVRLDVPYVRQEKNGCGAAAIAMILEYWLSRPADAKGIQQQLYSPKAGGVYASEMEQYLRQQGFRTFAIAGGWNDLREHLEKGRPIIVALKPRRNDLHYVVVTGLDTEQELVLSHDPAGRKSQKQHRADFEGEWKGAGNWMLLALPAQ